MRRQPVAQEAEHIFTPVPGATSQQCSCGKVFATTSEREQHVAWHLAKRPQLDERELRRILICVWEEDMQQLAPKFKKWLEGEIISREQFDSLNLTEDEKKHTKIIVVGREEDNLNPAPNGSTK